MMGNTKSLKAGCIYIGNYLIDLNQDIGSGSFGTIFEATDRTTGSMYAVKKMKYEFGNEISNELKDLTTEESRILKSLCH